MLIDQKYRRMCPSLPYYVLNVDFDVPDTALADPLLNAVPGWTSFDPIEGETIPNIGGNLYEQPQANNALDATKHRSFALPVAMPMSVRREAKEKELKTYGFEKLRDVLITIPKTILDTFNVDVKSGDEFVWQGKRFESIDVNEAGYWKNSPDVQFFMVINAAYARSGS